MKACIYGAGAIGGWLGVALAQAGHTVSMVARGDTLRALLAEGLRLRRPDGTLAQVAVTAHNDPAALGVQDLVVVAVKAPGLPDVARHGERLASSLRHAQSAVQRAVERRDERVTGWSNQLRSLDPRATLARGYAVVQLRDGKQAVTSVSQVKGKGKAKLDVHVKDGKFPAEVSWQYGF